MILITGTGRTGTSFLIQLFTHLGIKTGFSKQQVDKVMNERMCGLEKYKNVDIAKSPNYHNRLDGVEHVIIPIRDLTKGAKSRELRGSKPGGFWGGATNLEGQITYNAKIFYKLIYNLTKKNINFTLFEYPDFIYDENILYEKLEWLFKRYNISKELYLEKFLMLRDFDKITIK